MRLVPSSYRPTRGFWQICVLLALLIGKLPFPSWIQFRIAILAGLAIEFSERHRMVVSPRQDRFDTMIL
jgi:hypothetical protein